MMQNNIIVGFRLYSYLLLKPLAPFQKCNPLKHLRQVLFVARAGNSHMTKARSVQSCHAMQCTNMKFTSTTCNNREMEKDCKTIVKSDLSI